MPYLLLQQNPTVILRHRTTLGCAGEGLRCFGFKGVLECVCPDPRRTCGPLRHVGAGHPQSKRTGTGAKREDPQQRNDRDPTGG